MRSVLQLALRCTCCGLVAWQAMIAGGAWGERVIANSADAFGFRLTADTDARLRRSLGVDAELVFELRRLVPPDTLLLNRKVSGSIEELQRLGAAKGEQAMHASFAKLAAQNGLFDQLTTLLYPHPFLLSVPDAIALVEEQVRAGQEPWLFVLSGDPEPTDRAGWTCTHRTQRFQLWRFQKA